MHNMMRRFVMSLVACNVCAAMVLGLFPVQAKAAQRTIVLQKMLCGQGDAETINQKILSGKIASDALLILPEGEFSLAPLTVDGANNFTLRGTVDSSTGAPDTALSFSQSQGMTFQNAYNIRLENLNTEGPADAQLIVLQNSGDMQLENYFSLVGTGQIYQYCFTDFGWLVPIISFMLQ